MHASFVCLRLFRSCLHLSLVPASFVCLRNRVGSGGWNLVLASSAGAGRVCHVCGVASLGVRHEALPQCAYLMRAGAHGTLMLPSP